MAEHYDNNKSELQELIDYTNHSLYKGAEMRLEFEHDGISIFHVKRNDSIWSCNWDVSSDEKIDSLMQVVGLDQEELKNIRRKLRKLGCISIETATTHSDYADIGFRRVGLGKYSYRIYNRSMNPEEKKEYDEDPMFIPYTSLYRQSCIRIWRRCRWPSIIRGRYQGRVYEKTSGEVIQFLKYS